MAKDEQTVANTSSRQNAKSTRAEGKSKLHRHVPFAEATAIGRKLFEDEVKNFVGLLASCGLSQKQFCKKLIEACHVSSNTDHKSVNVENTLRQLQYVLSRNRKLNAPLAADYAKTLNITIKEFDEKLRHSPAASATVSPAIQKRLNEPATFRDIVPRFWKRLPRVECPRPHADGNNSTPPFQPNLGGDICYVDGWNIRLQASVHYRVTCDFVRNNVWPEVEIVLYEHDPHTKSWKRAESFGAVTSGKCASEFTPQVEEWLITCWGKNVIADDSFWFHFAPVPEAFDLDTTAGLLKLRFSAPNHQGGEGGLHVSKSAAESCPTVHMQVVE